tara:strand:+ start:1717 stop:2274 length:558 start_codon:yes stop_codon:yes gene_type:complete
MIYNLFPTKIYIEKMDITDEESEAISDLCNIINEVDKDKALFTQHNLECYPLLREVYDFFAKSFQEFLLEYDNDVTYENVYDMMLYKTGKISHSKDKEFKSINAPTNADLIALFFLSDKNLIVHDPSFNRIPVISDDREHLIRGEKNTIVVIPANVWHEIRTYDSEDNEVILSMEINIDKLPKMS